MPPGSRTGGSWPCSRGRHRRPRPRRGRPRRRVHGAHSSAGRRAGVPDNPEGWLLTVARNRQRDVWKSAATRANVPLGTTTPAAAERDRAGPARRARPAPDPRPAARAAASSCAHPAIDPRCARRSCCRRCSASTRRRSRRRYAVPAADDGAAARSREAPHPRARIPFAVPDRRAMPERLPAVLEAVYGCAAITWRDEADSLAGEAHVPRGHARRRCSNRARGVGARRARHASRSRGRRSGPFVPLEEQDPARGMPR